MLITTMGAALPMTSFFLTRQRAQTLLLIRPYGVTQRHQAAARIQRYYGGTSKRKAGGFRPRHRLLSTAPSTIRPRAVKHGRLRAGTSILMRSSTGNKLGTSMLRVTQCAMGATMFIRMSAAEEVRRHLWTWLHALASMQQPPARGSQEAMRLVGAILLVFAGHELVAAHR